MVGHKWRMMTAETTRRSIDCRADLIAGVFQCPHLFLLLNLSLNLHKGRLVIYTCGSAFNPPELALVMTGDGNGIFEMPL